VRDLAAARPQPASNAQQKVCGRFWYALGARTGPDVLITGFGTLTAQAAKAASPTIPIVFILVGDPVSAGLVASLGRPGGNVTGLSGLTEIGGKQLQFLQQLIPVTAAADATRTRVQVFEARIADQMPRQFEAAITAGASGLLVIADPLTYSHRRQISDLSAKVRLPSMYPSRDCVEEGGLMSYGFNRRLIYRRAAEYVDKI
jgi:putative ABC transport system substrate-binding protein